MSNRDEQARLVITIRGAVQGVGFRPFVYRLATELGLTGWVSNTPQGVMVEAEGPEGRLRELLIRLNLEKPPRSHISSLEPRFFAATGAMSAFEIRESAGTGERSAVVMPDIATCPDCLAEINDPRDRRHRYPFTNCTNCGPRYSIISALPYDRPNTSMRGFTMCAECTAEYGNPRDRRFHAQPNACPRCGPHLELWDGDGKALARDDNALRTAAQALRDGLVVAVKGLGGFHLMADAWNDGTVERLRHAKEREEKPFALMFPSIAHAEKACEVSPLEARLLASPEAPIVLLRKRPGMEGACAGVAPGNPYIGVMLPYTPLHHLLTREFGLPLVATSGNRADEPIATDEREALKRLHGIATLFLVHDRPILRHVDDSIVRVVLGREMVLRRARGYAPLPVPLPGAGRPVLALGAHLKNSVALASSGWAVVSQHIGDLETAESHTALRETVKALSGLYGLAPQAVACDLHPDYESTRYALSTGLPVHRVQHHYAHALSCLAENGVDEPALAVALDGTGLGTDGKVWGGEFLRVYGKSWTRAGHFRAFRLPGGDAAVREPRRTALGLMYEIHGPGIFGGRDARPVSSFRDGELPALRAMLERDINSPECTSAGRLFDAVAALTGVRQVNRFEGQSAMELEFLADAAETAEFYPFEIGEKGVPAVIDWAPAITALIGDAAAGTALGEVALKWHNTLVEMIIRMALLVGEKRVALTGGCFQNRILTERTVARLRAEGFLPFWHQRVPANDGGIALGQSAAAARAEAV